MKNIGLLFFSLFVLSLPQNCSSQLAIELKTGYVGGSPRVLDQYIYFKTSSLSDGKFEEEIIFGLTGKYFFTKNFYAGLQFDYYEMIAARIREITFEDFANVYSTISYGSLERERINSSLIVGHHIFKGFYAEIGGVYLYNRKNQLHGTKINEINKQITFIDLGDLQYLESDNFGLFVGLGFRVRKNGFYLVADYKYIIEEPTTFRDDTKFKLAYNSHSLIFGLGYFFGKKK